MSMDAVERRMMDRLDERLAKIQVEKINIDTYVDDVKATREFREREFNAHKDYSENILTEARRQSAAQERIARALERLARPTFEQLATKVAPLVSPTVHHSTDVRVAPGQLASAEDHSCKRCGAPGKRVSSSDIWYCDPCWNGAERPAPAWMPIGQNPVSGKCASWCGSIVRGCPSAGLAHYKGCYSLNGEPCLCSAYCNRRYRETKDSNPPKGPEPTPANDEPPASAVLVAQVDEKPTNPSPPDAGGTTTVQGGGDGGRRDADLAREFARAINRASRENESDTPDWILGEYLVAALRAFEIASNQRVNWWNDGKPPAEEPAPQPEAPSAAGQVAVAGRFAQRNRDIDEGKWPKAPVAQSEAPRKTTEVIGRREPAVAFERAVPGADGCVGAIFRLPDGRRVRITVEPEGTASATIEASGAENVYRDVEIPPLSQPEESRFAGYPPFDQPPERAHPACPSSQCLMCTGEACDKCGAGCGNNNPSRAKCEHDVLERHEKPAPNDTTKSRTYVCDMCGTTTDTLDGGRESGPPENFWACAKCAVGLPGETTSEPANPDPASCRDPFNPSCACPSCKAYPPPADPDKAQSLAERNFVPVVSGAPVPSSAEVEASWKRDHEPSKPLSKRMQIDLDAGVFSLGSSRTEEAFACRIYEVANLEARLAAAEKSRNYEASCRAACLIEIDRLTLALAATEKAREKTCPFPESLDGTEGACHAWWRGEMRAAEAWKERIAAAEKWRDEWKDAACREANGRRSAMRDAERALKERDEAVAAERARCLEIVRRKIPQSEMRLQIDALISSSGEPAPKGDAGGDDTT